MYAARLLTLPVRPNKFRCEPVAFVRPYSVSFDLQRLQKYSLSSDQILETGKFRYLDDHLPEMKTRGDRVLVFSQFTMILDILEQYMTLRGHKYLRLDGSTAVAERYTSIPVLF